MKHIKGFTLIELIVVIVILATLSALALPRFTSLQRDARIAKLNAARGAVATASALTHATVLAKNNVGDPVACAGGGTANNLNGAAGTLCTEGGIVRMVFGYPDVTAISTPGLLSAAGLTTSFNPTLAELNADGYNYAATGTQATFQIQGATTPGNCQFTYTEPAAANAAPVITAVVTTGC